MRDEEARANMAGEGRAPALSSLSLERGLRVLAAFDHGDPALGLTEVIALTGLEKTAVLRFLATLVAAGYLVKDARTRRYSPAARMLHLGASFLRGSPLIQRAMPYLLACARELEETVNLGMLDGDEALLLARVPSRHIVSPNIGVGSAFPWHVSGLGQSIVAYLPAPERDALLRRVVFVRRATNSIMDRQTLERRLEDVRLRRSVVVRDENYDGDITIAAPVFDAAGQVVAAVNIVVAPQRWSPERAAALRAHVLHLASAISSSQAAPELSDAVQHR